MTGNPAVRGGGRENWGGGGWGEVKDRKRNSTEGGPKNRGEGSVQGAQNPQVEVWGGNNHIFWGETSRHASGRDLGGQKKTKEG